MNIIKTTIAAAAAVAALSIASCGSSSDSDASAADTASVAYHAGDRKAVEMFDMCRDSVEIQDFLLQFHADTHQLREKEGEQAAANYRLGFEHRLRKLDPDLASKIF